MIKRYQVIHDLNNTGQDEFYEFLETSRRPRWRRWMKFWLPALILLTLTLIFKPWSGKQSGPEYIAEPVVERSLDLTVSATGNLRPTNQVEVGSELSGRIERVFVEVNDRVARGQVLARINTDVIDDQIKQAQASLNAVQAQLAQAKATYAVDAAQLARLQDVYRISGGKVPSRVELEQATAAARRSQAGVAAAEANVRAAQAVLSTSITNRERSVIRSPVAGVVLVRQIDAGQTVAASFNTPTLFIIAEDLSTMQLRVDVDEADVGQVEPGQKATFRVDAYPGRKFDAVVERIDKASSNLAGRSGQQANRSEQNSAVVTYEARLSVNNVEGFLRPGMTATATIATQSTGKALLIPNSALRFRPHAPPKAEDNVLNPKVGLEQKEQEASIGIGSKQTVQVLQADGKLKPVVVVTGHSDGRMTAVTSDKLRPGMKVVTGKKARSR